ncbi:MAG: LytTR family transcriptional regulator [Firmicutes bacterium]|nr:LytTR family transcriptional regulator [Bacillota bacterium]
MKGFVIIGNDGETKMKLLENQLKEDLGAREYVPREGGFFPADRSEVLSFRKGNRERHLSADRIVYLEKQLRKMIVALEGGGHVSFYGSMEEAMEQLADRFCRCHKSYAVNLEKVVTLEEGGFRMKDGSFVPVSQRRRREVRWRYEEFQEQKNIEKLRFPKTFSCFEL